MADKKSNSVKALRGILGPISGSLINVKFDKNNRLEILNNQKNKNMWERTYLLVGTLNCADNLLVKKIVAFSSYQAKNDWKSECPEINILCCQALKS